MLPTAFRENCRVLLLSPRARSRYKKNLSALIVIQASPVLRTFFDFAKLFLTPKVRFIVRTWADTVLFAQQYSLRRTIVDRAKILFVKVVKYIGFMFTIGPVNYGPS